MLGVTAGIIAQIPWAAAGTSRSQAKREETPGGPDITKEEKLMAAVFSANQDLVDVFNCYEDWRLRNMRNRRREDIKAVVRVLCWRTYWTRVP